MKKSFFCFVAILLLLCSNAMAGEFPAVPAKVCWTMMHNVPTNMTDRNNRTIWISRQVLHTYDMTTGEYDEQQIPNEWRVIDSDVDEGIPLVISYQEHERDMIDTMSLEDGKVKPTNPWWSWRLPGYDEILAYKQECVYYQCRDSDFEYTHLFRMNRDREIFDYGAFYGYPAVSDEGSVALIEYFYGECYSGDVIACFTAEGEKSYISPSPHLLKGVHDEGPECEPNYETFLAPAWLDDHRLLFWGELPHDTPPTQTLYYDFRGACEVSINAVHELLCYDTSTGEYARYLDENGEPIRQLDYDVIKMEVHPDSKTLLCSRISSPTIKYVGHFLDLVAVSLETGDMITIYQPYGEPYSVDILWEYATLKYSRFTIGKRTEEQRRRLQELEDLLQNRRNYFLEREVEFASLAVFYN